MTNDEIRNSNQFPMTNAQMVSVIGHWSVWTLIRHSNFVIRVSLRAILMCSAAALFTGCSQYELRGKVIPGPTSQVLVVGKHDSRLEVYGIEGAAVSAMIDPDKANRELAGSVASDAGGEFAIPVEHTGAGFLMYDVRVTARLVKHAPAQRTMALPGGDKRVLIMLAPGEDTLPSQAQDDILKETMEMTRPYRDGP